MRQMEGEEWEKPCLRKQETALCLICVQVNMEVPSNYRSDEGADKLENTCIKTH
jgi:hypothetical protein